MERLTHVGRYPSKFFHVEGLLITHEINQDVKQSYISVFA